MCPIVGISRPPNGSLILRTALLLLVLTASFASAQSGPVQYGYDELGRLVVVVDGAGNTAIYNYDSVGNLLSIQRADASSITDPVAITAIAPTKGPVGSSVSIFGKGFSPTPAQNTVSFNGGLATVTSALPTHLRVVVSAAAVNGPITVTAPTGSATSAQSFRVIGPLTVTPAGATIVAAHSLQYNATGPGGAPPTVDWVVNDIPGGNASLGAISASGLYTAPASVAQQFPVTITATDHDDPASKGSTAALIVPVGLQRSAVARGVSISVGSGSGVVNNLLASVSAVIGGNHVVNSVESLVSAVIGGHPTSTASTAVSVSASPVITAVSPTTGARGVTALTVTLAGIGFADATQVTFLLNNVPDTTITSSLTNISPDGTQATLQISIASAAATGVRVVEISTPTGTSTVVGTGANAFTVQ